MVSDFVEFQQANVYGIYGLLGGGKTLTAVEIAIEFLRRGFSVASNVRLRNLDGFSGSFIYLDDFALVDYWKLPKGAPRGSSSKFRSAVVIDECAEFFDQNSFASPLTKKFTSWLRESSKNGQFVFLVVQHPDFIAKALRKIVSRWICCVDLGQFRIPVLCCHIPFMRGYVFRSVFDRQGNRISRGLCLGRKTEIGRYYDTSQHISILGREDCSEVEYTPSDNFWIYFWIVFAYLSALFIYT